MEEAIAMKLRMRNRHVEPSELDILGGQKKTNAISTSA